jgi:hypothetical protein
VRKIYCIMQPKVAAAGAKGKEAAE